MSAVDVAVREFRTLEPEDLQLLEAIEQQMKNYEYAPKDAIQNQSKFPFSEIDFRLPTLIKRGLVRGKRGKYVGYGLTTSGHDTLALDALVKADVIEAFGKSLGVGKESDVYFALTPDQTQVALKFHRVGRTSFKKTKLKRNYSSNYSYTPDWHHQSRIAAKKEYAALKLLFPKGVAVPEPIKQTRHVLVMSIIDGAEVFRFPELPDAQDVFDEILLNVKKAYQEVHMIHGDLSPYNIILQPNRHILIIDWPQNVSTKHPNAKELLERDLTNVIDFFKRKYGLKKDLEAAVNYVTGKSEN
ncbi:MAG: serine/threonine protein kinase, partial [Candidatus Bathyarchaeota archaeon]|nr:serine/threonine protein kinase [Candidatus Bathyarchaeota archaeon]